MKTLYCGKCERDVPVHLQFRGGAEFPLPPATFICSRCHAVLQTLERVSLESKAK